MSVCLIVSNPISKEEDEFIVPIAAEQIFQEFWIPVIDTLDLQWIKCFQSGIEIEKEDFESVLKELEKIQLWIDKNMNDERGNHITKRIDTLKKELIILLENTRNDLKVFIG